MYKLRDWIDGDKLYINGLCKNECMGVLEILENNKNILDIWSLAKNKNIMCSSIDLFDELEKIIERDDIDEIGEILGGDDDGSEIFAQVYNAHYKRKEIMRLLLTNLLWSKLSGNEGALNLLNNNIEKINWCEYCENRHPNMTELFNKKTNEGVISLFSLCENPNAMKLVEEKKEELTDYHFNLLSKNPNAIKLLKENEEKINWDNMCVNEKGYELLERNRIITRNDLMCKNRNEKVLNLVRMDMKVDWCSLCSNPNGIKYVNNIMDNLGDECWSSLCSNENPEVIEILKRNKSRIDWEELSKNVIIFEYDYKRMQEEKEEINREIIEYIYNPKKMYKWAELGL